MRAALNKYIRKEKQQPRKNVGIRDQTAAESMAPHVWWGLEVSWDFVLLHLS